MLRILVSALVIVTLLGCSASRYRQKYANMPPDQLAREYLSLDSYERSLVDRELTADERRRLDQAIADLDKPTPSPSPEASPVAEHPPETSPTPESTPVAGPPPPPPPAPGAPPVAFTPDLTPREYLDRLFDGKGDTHSRLYIPGYSYFQGAVGSGASVTVAGQVRVIGGLAGGSGRLSDGAMVTTNPDYLDGRVTPGRNRFRIVEWKEVD